MPRLTARQSKVLRAILSGWTLKAHRDLDGAKVYRLHPPRGDIEIVAASTVQSLVSSGLLDSNKKFPAATFWLTEAGRRAAERLGAPKTGAPKVGEPKSD